MAPCPESMECQSGACQYNASMAPADSDSVYVVPEGMGTCPAGSIAASFTTGFWVCIPECDEADMCPASDGGGVPFCGVNPTSSGEPC